MRARLVFTALSTLSVVVLVGLAGLGTAGSAAAHEEPVPSSFRGLITTTRPPASAVVHTRCTANGTSS